MISRDNFNNEINKTIDDRLNDKPLTSIDSYDKKYMDIFKTSIIDKINKYITDDYYNQDYIDSFCNNLKKILDKFKGSSIYSKTNIDNTILIMELLLSTKQSKDDKMMDNDWLNELLCNINLTDSTSIYTKSDIDAILNTYIKKDSIESNMITCKYANELNTKIDELQNLLQTHINDICDTLTDRGINTPKDSSIYLICGNIAQLAPSSTELKKSYILTKILSLESPSCKICSDNNSNIYVSYNDKICIYSNNGILLKSVNKQISGNTIGIFEDKYDNKYIYIIDDNNYLTLLDKLTLDIVYCKKIFLNSKEYNDNITRVYYKPNISGMNHNINIPGHNHNHASIFNNGYIFIIDDTIGNIYFLNEYDLFNNLSQQPNIHNAYWVLGYDTDTVSFQHKFTTNSNLIYRYISNEISIFPVQISYGNTVYVKTINIDCDNIDYMYTNNLENIILCADNKIYTLDIVFNINKELYTYNGDINSITNISRHVAHILENNNRIISIDTRDSSKTIITDLDVDINYMYTDILNRVICVSNDSLYLLIESESE